MQHLEVLSNESMHQKQEYSLSQHLANNLIDLYGKSMSELLDFLFGTIDACHM